MTKVHAWFGGLLTMLACAACSSAPYGQATVGFSEAVSNLRTSGAALSLREAEGRQLNYDIVSLTQPDRLRATPGCKGAANTSPSNCFIATDRQIRDERQAAKTVNEAINEALKTTAATDRPLTTLDYLSALGIPKECAAPIDAERARGSAKADANPSEIEVEKPIGLAQTEAELLAGLDRYAKALAAITNEKDVEAYKAAAGKLSSSLGTIAGAAGAVAGGAPAAIGPIVTAASNLVWRLKLASLERDRFEALKEAVLAACLPVHSIAIAEGIFLNSSWVIGNSSIRAVLEDPPRVASNASVALLARPILLRAAELMRASGPDPKPIAEKIAATHDALVKAVVSGQGQTEALNSLVSDLVEQTAALKGGLEKK